MPGDSEARAIDQSVQSFLRDYIRSFEQLETLLLLHRHRDRAWSTDEVAARLFIPEIPAHEAIVQLMASGLVAAEGPSLNERAQSDHFRYSPSDPLLEATVERLVQACEQRRIEVMRVMSAQSIERVRTNVMRVFADAFLLGKRPDRPGRPGKPGKPGKREPGKPE